MVEISLYQQYCEVINRLNAIAAVMARGTCVTTKELAGVEREICVLEHEFVALVGKTFQYIYDVNTVNKRKEE